MSLLWYRRPQVELLFQETDHGHSQGPCCFSNYFQEILRTLHRLRAILNFSVQQQVLSNSIHLLFLISIHSLFLSLLSWSLVWITLINSGSSSHWLWVYLLFCRLKICEYSPSEDICNSSGCPLVVWWFIKQHYLQNY